MRTVPLPALRVAVGTKVAGLGHSLIGLGAAQAYNATELPCGLFRSSGGKSGDCLNPVAGSETQFPGTFARTGYVVSQRPGIVYIDIVLTISLEPGRSLIF
jgi:hypothetical protein